MLGSACRRATSRSGSPLARATVSHGSCRRAAVAAAREQQEGGGAGDDERRRRQCEMAQDVERVAGRAADPTAVIREDGSAAKQREPVEPNGEHEQQADGDEELRDRRERARGRD